MLVTSKAISYAKMKKYRDGGDVYDIMALADYHDQVWTISVTDLDIPPLFKNSNHTMILQFDDVDPRGTRHLYDGVASASSMVHEDHEEIDQMITEVLFKHAFTIDQAKEVVDFIVKAHSNPDSKDMLLVNCMAGVSRSGAIATFAQQICRIDYDEFCRQNPQIVPNPHVGRMLNEYYSSLLP